SYWRRAKWSSKGSTRTSSIRKAGFTPSCTRRRWRWRRWWRFAENDRKRFSARRLRQLRIKVWWLDSKDGRNLEYRFDYFRRLIGRASSHTRMHGFGSEPDGKVAMVSAESQIKRARRGRTTTAAVTAPVVA